MKNFVSVIVTTKNEESVIESLLMSLKKQSYPKKEIIIVDNNSTDSTKKISRKYTSKVFNFGPERSAQRNYGVSKAKGDFVLMLDADMSLTKNVLAECINQVIVDQKIGALIIPEKSFGVGFWAKCKAFEREFYEGEESIEAARFFKKKLFKKFDGYDLSITGPEDWDLPLRMKKEGVKIDRINSYILHNEGRLSFRKIIKKKFYYGNHAYQYFKKHPEKFLTHGNLLFRPVFLKKWKKIISHPILSLGMLLMRMSEMFSAMLGIIKYLTLDRVTLK